MKFYIRIHFHQFPKKNFTHARVRRVTLQICHLSFIKKRMIIIFVTIILFRCFITIILLKKCTSIGKRYFKIILYFTFKVGNIHKQHTLQIFFGF